MQGLKPHRLYGASNWLGSKPHPITSPSLPHSLPPSLFIGPVVVRQLLTMGYEVTLFHR